MYTITEVDTLGYGDPTSSISYDKQLASGELPSEVAEYGAELIRSGECILATSESDDGCIDGRPAASLLYVAEDGKFHTKPILGRSEHERAKVAGGGYVTASAMQIAIYGPGVEFDEDLALVATNLMDTNVVCGAHTSGAHDDATTGCGANDKIDVIFANGIRFADSIGATLKDLLSVAGIAYEPSLFQSVIANWQLTLDEAEYFAHSTGASRFVKMQEAIKAAQQKTGSYEKPVAVSKELAGSHKEDFIVLNYVDGETFSQAQFAQKMHEKFPTIADEQLAQAFVVDVARIVTLAKALTSQTSGQFTKALYAGVAYQLATAATLTDGTLRNFVVTK